MPLSDCWSIFWRPMFDSIDYDSHLYRYIQHRRCCLPVFVFSVITWHGSNALSLQSSTSKFYNLDFSSRLISSSQMIVIKQVVMIYYTVMFVNLWLAYMAEIFAIYQSNYSNISYCHNSPIEEHYVWIIRLVYISRRKLSLLVWYKVYKCIHDQIRQKMQHR